MSLEMYITRIKKNQFLRKIPEIKKRNMVVAEHLTKIKVDENASTKNFLEAINTPGFLYLLDNYQGPALETMCDLNMQALFAHRKKGRKLSSNESLEFDFGFSLHEIFVEPIIKKYERIFCENKIHQENIKAAHKIQRLFGRQEVIKTINLYKDYNNLYRKLGFLIAPVKDESLGGILQILGDEEIRPYLKNINGEISGDEKLREPFLALIFEKGISLEETKRLVNLQSENRFKKIILSNNYSSWPGKKPEKYNLRYSYFEILSSERKPGHLINLTKSLMDLAEEIPSDLISEKIINFIFYYYKKHYNGEYAYNFLKSFKRIAKALKDIQTTSQDWEGFFEKNFPSIKNSISENRAELENICEKIEKIKELGCQTLAETSQLIQTGVSGYHIISKIAEGGFNKVYKVKTTTKHGSEIIRILKVPKEGYDFESSNAKKIIEQNTPEKMGEKGAALQDRLQHPHIIKFHHYVDVYIGNKIIQGTIEDYIEGKNLKVFCQEINPEGKSIGVDISYRIKKIFSQISSAVVHLHNMGVVHNDLKLENVLIDSEENAYLTDFGVSLDEKSAETYHGDRAYAAPETLRGEKPTEKSDIWSLGIMLYQAKYGKFPFSFKEKKDLSAILEENKEDYSKLIFGEELRIDDDKEIDQQKMIDCIIYGCLKYDPKRRPTAKEINYWISMSKEADAITQETVLETKRLPIELDRILEMCEKILSTEDYQYLRTQLNYKHEEDKNKGRKGEGK